MRIITIKTNTSIINKGLRREELSLLLGFDNSYISKLEKEKINITADKIQKIADYFKLEPYILLKPKDDQ